MRSIRQFLQFVFVLALCSPGWPQSSLTSLRGTVTDPSGAVVPTAEVSLENPATGTKVSKTANAAGEYVFQQLVPGTYTITARASGFGEQSKKAELLVNQPATVNFSLSVQSATTTVDVSAEAQTLNTTDASIGNSMDNAMIQALPAEGRNVPDLLSLQPGVLYLGRGIDANTDSRTGSVAGARSDQTNVTLDGLDDNDQEAGFAFTGVLRSTLDSIQEFRVTTTGSNADAGRSSGGQVSMVTKSGTNQFHGSAYEYNRNTFTVANDWFNKAAQKSSGQANVPGKLIRNTFGAAVGGPIKKDRLFFFGNYEGQRTAENKQVTQIAPTASFKAGNISYPSNGSTITLNRAQIASMDSEPNGQNCTYYGTCPNGPGVNSAVLAYLNQFPTANGSALGDGFNLGSFSFSSPHPGSLNTSIAKLDYQLNQSHHLFVRGNLQKDTQSGIMQFPGQPASSMLIDNTKGIAAGDTWAITPNLVNDLRYGYTRQGYSNRGTGQGAYVVFRFLTQWEPETRSTIVNVPVHNIIDSVSYTKGKHNLAGGINWRLINNNRSSDANSYSSGNTNIYWINTGGTIAGQGIALDPAAHGFAPVDEGFSNSYSIAIGALVGLVPQTNGQYNFDVAKDGLTGKTLAQGAFVNRDFKANEFEYFLQDSWRVRSNLTVTYGLRQTILQAPYETHGQQIAPTTNMHKWFETRAVNAAKGITTQPDISFAAAGQARGLKPYWDTQKDAIAPRISVAYSPTPLTSIRAGFGMNYDHFGQGIVNSFDQNGSFGLSTNLANPAGAYSVDNSPRFTGIHDVPPLQGVNIPSVIAYPYTPPNDVNTGFAITWGIDDHLRTPYAETVDFSVQQQLPKGFIMETAYVGRFGHHLMQQLDLAQPLNLVDPKSGLSYFQAATLLSKAVDANGGDPNASIAAIPYFENMFPQWASDGVSATQNIYSQLWAFNRGNETTGLAVLDAFCGDLCTPNFDGNGLYEPRFYQRQFSSLYAWSSIGNSNYHALQFTLRHAMSNGLQVDASYTFSKSMDMGSDTERTGELNAGRASNSEILNAFNTRLNRGLSDFDIRHLITFNWVYELPLGQGKAYWSGANSFVNSFIGGWQWSGLGRWSSGLPFSISQSGWTTDWQIGSNMVQTGYIKMRKHIDSSGSPQVFDNPDAINNGIAAGTPLRFPYPGEAGPRNNFRGDGFFGVDSGLAKNWKITERQAVRFTWEVFNATNSVRFDTNPQSANGGLTTQAQSGSLGKYASTLTAPRIQQFSLRYSF
ncbi:MAG TPA: TonB-dependent receptor [Acidisarcina sp.]|nr:TonB-dependent receptor [Acidisarcina sp.]